MFTQIVINFTGRKYNVGNLLVIWGENPVIRVPCYSGKCCVQRDRRKIFHELIEVIYILFKDILQIIYIYTYMYTLVHIYIYLCVDMNNNCYKVFSITTFVYHELNSIKYFAIGSRKSLKTTTHKRLVNLRCKIFMLFSYVQKYYYYCQSTSGTV